jgi:hypothetical protein
LTTDKNDAPSPPKALVPLSAVAARHQNERQMNFLFRDHSTLRAYFGSQSLRNHLGRGVAQMPEFLRSSAIMLMGLTVMAAGVAVVLYG